MTRLLSKAARGVGLVLILAPVAAADAPFITDYEAFNSYAFGFRPNQTYHSSTLQSPRFLVNQWDKAKTSSESHIFLAPGITGQGFSPMIFSAKDLSLVYADPDWRGGTDTKIQSFNGSEYLTFWSGYDFTGRGTGGGVILDETYQMLANLTTVGMQTGADSHDFQLTHDGGALLNNYHTKHGFDFSSVGGPNAAKLMDCAFQEVDVETGELRFEWHASEHFSLDETFGDSYETADDTYGWDWFHQNSLFKTLRGDYLISGRHLRMLALINGTDGSKIWQLGGKNNMFRDLSGGKATDFAYQHHARFVDEKYTEITLFDNHVMHDSSRVPNCDFECSRAIRVRLDYEHMTAELVHEIYHPKSVQAWAQGGHDVLRNGNNFIAWGVVPSFTEHTDDGELVMEVQTGPWANTNPRGVGRSDVYRAYKFDWVAHPPWDPAIALVDGVVYVSWNGATEVAEWQLHGGDHTYGLSAVQKVPRAGFETSITTESLPPYVKVDALDASGRILGSSSMVSSADGQVVFDVMEKYTMNGRPRPPGGP